MNINEIVATYKKYSNTANVNALDFLSAANQLEGLAVQDMDTPLYRISQTNASPLLDIIRSWFPLPYTDDSEIAYMIILEVVISIYIYSEFIEEGDIKTFRNNMLDIDSSLDNEVKMNKDHEYSLELIYGYLDNISSDIDMDLCDVFYNHISNPIDVLKQFKISNNEYLVSFLGWSKDNKTISFIIS